MPDTPLNPDALDETALANLIAWKSLPFGATQFVKLDANAAHKVIELLRPHLAVARPEVNTVEELDALPEGTVLLVTDKRPGVGKSSWELFSDVLELRDSDGELEPKA